MRYGLVWTWIRSAVLVLCALPGVGDSDEAGEEPPAFERFGLSFEGLYTLDLIRNVDGGIRRETEVIGNLDLVLVAELESLLGWKGGRILLYGLGTHGDGISPAVGDVQAVDNIEAPETFKLYEAWIEQDVLGDLASIRAGLYDVNSEFDVIPSGLLFVHSSPGTGAELALSGRNGPSIFPVTSLGARFDFRPSGGWYARGVVADGVAGDPGDPKGTQISLGNGDGLFLAAEAGIEVEEPNGSEDPTYVGKYAVGTWAYTGEFDDLRERNGVVETVGRHASPGVYAFVDQRIYAEADDPGQGCFAFFRAGLADGKASLVDRYLGAGLVYRGPFSCRDEDRVGVAVAAARLSSEFQRSAADGGRREDWEVAFEATYNAIFGSCLAVQPFAQLVRNPSGDPQVEDATILGLRVLFAF